MPDANQRQVCWEKIVGTNPLFRLTHPYSSGACSEQLVAIYALFACLDQLVMQSTDDLIARTKLEWWRLETLGDNLARSRHPVVGFLHESGAAASLTNAALRRFLDAIARTLDARAPADVDELVHLCREIYQPRIEIESALMEGEELPVKTQHSLAVRGGMTLLFQVAFNQQQGLENSLWWMPLSLLARNEVSRAGLTQEPGSTSARAIFNEILSSGSSSPIDYSRGKLSCHTHLLLLDYLHGRQLGRLQKIRPVSYRKELRRFYLRDVLSLWRTAREIRRSVEF